MLIPIVDILTWACFIVGGFFLFIDQPHHAQRADEQEKPTNDEAGPRQDMTIRVSITVSAPLVVAP